MSNLYKDITPNGDVRYSYKDKDGMKYTTPEPKLSKKDKLYCPWIKVYDTNTKQSGFVNRNNPKYYKVSGHFIKHIAILKEEEKEQFIFEKGLYDIDEC